MGNIMAVPPRVQLVTLLWGSVPWQHPGDSGAAVGTEQRPGPYQLVTILGAPYTSRSTNDGIP